ncbi:MAG: CsbD family protein [Chloroflexi bacterium]|nr:MAG: CsbD family protein [Chloroflexota bacterium]
MDKDKIEGTVKEGAGKAEGAWGDTTNDPETEARGKEREGEGKLQKGWGGAKEKIGDAFDGDKS